MDEFYGGNVYKYSIEPTSPKGLHRYIDLASMLPTHVQNRPDIMKIVWLFQDYLNDGYRKIPDPTTMRSYKSKFEDGCHSAEITYLEIARPLNHDPSMYKKRLSAGLDYSNIGGDQIEEYYKERDLYTWAIEDSDMDEYKEKYPNKLFGNTEGMYSYYNEPKQYFNSLAYYTKMNDIVNSNIGNNDLFTGTYMYFSAYPRDNSISLDENSMELVYLKQLLPQTGELPNIVFTYYACDPETFQTDFSAFAGNPARIFKVEERKVPFYYGISDYINHNKVPYFSSTIYMSYDDVVTAINNPPANTPIFLSSFRVSITYHARKPAEYLRTNFLDLLPSTPVGTFAFEVQPENITDVANFVYGDIPFIGSSLLSIYAYEHPEAFYKHFSWQNEYRHEAKGASIAEKIYRMAYTKDPNVFDYEYLRLISQHFGYSIETDEQEINQNSYYRTKEEKEEVLRNLIRNTPEYNRMKGTDSGIEMVLLSFGLVGRIVTLYTRGDSKVPGYVDFIDSNAVSGDIEEYLISEGITVKDKYDNNGILIGPYMYSSEGYEIGPYDEDEVTQQMSEQFQSHSTLGNTSVYDWYASPHFRVEFDLLKDYLNIAKSSEHFATIAKTIKRVKPINTVFQGFYAKLSAEYGHLFINPPICMNKSKMIRYEESECSFEDKWSEQCALELTHDS